ncbi:MAG: phosphatase PAP2 family protein [Proteobacteria bacterium]|nr:MAG: phosphatase PAP2 family protein [Pseudomonadota bacterium]
MDYLFNLDRHTLYLINGRTWPPGLHALMIFCSTANNSRFFYWIFLPLLLGILVYVSRRKALPILLTAATVAALTDLLNYRVIKMLSFRMRPWESDPNVYLRVPYGPQSSSFPSNHATTTMALAVWFSHLYPKGTPYFIVIPLLVGISRIYVGVHYPSDILGAWILGALLGTFFAKISIKQLKPT